MLAKDGRLYVSSAPFDDPRILPGGPGIDYFVEGERGTIRPQSPGRAWGMEFLSKEVWGLRKNEIIRGSRLSVVRLYDP